MIEKTGKLILAFILLCAGCLKAQEQVIDEVIWIVGDEAILKSDVEDERQSMLMAGEKFDGDPYCFIPEQLAVKKLFLDQAKIDSITISNSDVAKGVTRYENFMIQRAGSKEKLEEYLRMPMTQLREKWREDIKSDELIKRTRDKIIGSKVKLTPSEIRKFYNQLPKDSLPYIPTSVEVQLITYEPVIPLKELDAVRERLRDFTNQVQSGKADFATLAIMYSEDPGSANNGGELGFMGKTMLMPEFANMAFSLSDPKKVSNIVETEAGFHIIQLIERRGDRVNVRHILLRPKVSRDEINKAIARVDSLANSIRNNEISFDEATYYSSDKSTRNNHGLMVNQEESVYYGTSRFRMEDLPKEIALVVDTMKVGNVSTAFKMKLKTGREVVAIVKLKSRIDGHVANISDDYQALKAMVEEKKRQNIVRKWLKDKINQTYIYIDNDWKNCDFQYEGWVK